MNDFSELENELKKLRPGRPSPVLFERVEEALSSCRAGATPAKQPQRLTYNWLSFGLAAAAAAVLLLLARMNTNQPREQGERMAQLSTAPKTSPVPSRAERATALDEFIPADVTQVVYNRHNDGLQFADGSAQPLRRLRYQTHQTWQWRNPTSGASLRVSYPSEEVVLIPVSGQ